MQAVAAKPIIDNLADPEIAKHFAAKNSKNPWLEFIASVGKFLKHTLWPMHYGLYRTYVGFRASAYQAQLAEKDYYRACGIAFVLSYLWMVMLQSIDVTIYTLLGFEVEQEFKLFLSFSLFHFGGWYMLCTSGLNLYCSTRFSKPDYRAWNIKFNPAKKAMVARQIVKRLGAKQQLKAIGKSRWHVDLWNCDARLHWKEFPDDSIQTSCIGTDSKEWIWIRFNDPRYEKHIGAVFGDWDFDNKNLVRVLVKAALGDPNTGIVMVDANPSTGASFAEYEGLMNVALCLGTKKSFAAIETIWNELKARNVQRIDGSAKSWPRLVLVLDDYFSRGVNRGFWSKKTPQDNISSELKRISYQLNEIVDAGKIHNVHVICVYDNDKYNFFAWLSGHKRFENFATYWRGTIPKKGKGGESVSESVVTHDYPFLDMIKVTWQPEIMFKTMHLPEGEFIQYAKERSVHLCKPTKYLLDEIRNSKPSS